MRTFISLASTRVHRAAVLALCFCVTLLLCGCTPTASQTPSSTSSDASTTNSNSTTTPATTNSNTTPSNTGDKVSMTGLDGEPVNTGTTPSSSNDSTTTPSATPSGNSVAGSGGQTLLTNLRNAGLSGENLRLAWSVAMAESSGNPRAHNTNTRTGDNSYGLFQINMLGAMGPERRRQFGISNNDELFDPQTNIRAAKMVSNNWSNWSPWSTYKNGAYRRYYSQFPG